MPRRASLVLFCWLALFGWIVATPVAAQLPEPSLSFDDYRAQLAAAIDELNTIPDEDADPYLRELYGRFEQIKTVTLPSGEEIPIRSLFEQLPLAPGEEFVPDEWTSPLTLREVALAQLRGALAQIDASSNDNTAARLAILTEILARPEFNTPLSLWDRFLQWLDQLISEWWPEADANAGSGWLALLIRLLPWIVTILILAAIIWLLSYWLQHLLRAFVTDARILQMAGDDNMPSTAAEARQQARAAAQSGLYRDAVRRLYLAALLHLAESDLITYERSLTNREVLVRVPKNSPVRPHLEPVIATFDRVWYGVREPDQATFNAYEQEINALTAVATRAASDSLRREEAE